MRHCGSSCRADAACQTARVIGSADSVERHSIVGRAVDLLATVLILVSIPVLTWWLVGDLSTRPPASLVGRLAVPSLEHQPRPRDSRGVRRIGADPWGLPGAGTPG